MPRKTFEVAGVGHAGAPIPLAAQVGDFFHSSGISGADRATGRVPADGPTQVSMAFRNAATVLAQAGLTPADVVHLDVYLEDDSLRTLVNDEWLAWYPAADDRPARHTTVRELPGPMLVQLQVQAVRTGSPPPAAAARLAAEPQSHDQWVVAARRLSTSVVSDALDRLGIAGQVHGIGPIVPDQCIAGRAFTLLYEPVDADGGTVGNYIDDVPEGAIVMLDNQGREDCTVWGDILTSVAHRRKVGGTVIDGICRDVDRARTLGYPVFARGHWMRTGKDRVRLAAAEVAVSIGGVNVHPGDLVVGDADGLVVVPARAEQRVLEVAHDIDQAEERIRAMVEGGRRLDEARREEGYFTLQRPTTDEP